ncbi:MULTISPECIES: nuclear transport factor 2 family protein [Pantoea]|uniref:Nuclear transport factor 2 family protein n=2 Tax=Pantoea phytobeneficialis TaxID=2052056 RepID=A0ABT8XUM0_9GAMM|nr:MULTISPECIES: nuclear transport factor 2 family protein [Pantoea]MDO6406624.1 nuclear transport factor 2 family protein [Pantoea phytobeneficialis]
MMSERQPVEVIEEFLQRAATSPDVSTIAELVSEEVDWFVAGDVAVVPWIGRKHGKAGAVEFYRQIREQISSEHFEVGEMLVLGGRVMIPGRLASRVNKTGKLIESEFVLDFTVTDGLITRFRLFEDSYAVAQACV